MKEKLKALGYRIMTCENIMVGTKHFNDFYLDITLTNGIITDYEVMGSSFIRNQSDIDNLQIAYNVLKSDLKELLDEKEKEERMEND